MKKELFLFVLLSVFITLIDLGAQIRGTQTWYTVANFGLNQPLAMLSGASWTTLHNVFTCAMLSQEY